MADADKLTEWLAANVCEAERRSERLYRPVAGEPDAYPRLGPALSRPIRPTTPE